MIVNLNRVLLSMTSLSNSYSFTKSNTWS